MSILNTAPMLVAAPAAVNTNVVIPASAWTYGSWVQLIASAVGNVAIAGISIGPIAAGSYSDNAIEFQIGTGAPGSEAAIGTIKIYGTNSGAGSGPDVYMLPVPLGGIVNGDKVSIRAQYGSALTATIPVALLYYSNLSSDQFTALTTPYTASSLASNGVAVTPNAGPWVNSAWFVLSSGLSTSAAITGLAFFDGSVAGIDYEFDLGTGAVGSETVITTLRGGRNGTVTRLTYLNLPVPYLLDAGTKVSVRIRKSGADVTNRNVNLLYIASVVNPNAPTPPARGKPTVGVATVLSGGTIYSLPATTVNVEWTCAAAAILEVSVDGTTFFTASSQVGAGTTVVNDISAMYIRPSVDVTALFRKKKDRL